MTRIVSGHRILLSCLGMNAPMFYRRATDGTRLQVPLENQYAGPVATPCWLIGAGPSLSKLDLDEISRSPASRFGVNLAGSGLIRPDLWTSYDPTVRFHRSIYLDSSVIKFVHESRAMDLIPETTYKVCDAPNLYLIDRTQTRGFHEFPGQSDSPITDWQDSLIQAIDIAYRLGFRELYLTGCDLWIAPSRAWRRAAATLGVVYQPREPLGDFVHRCEHAGMERARMEELNTGPQYHFDECKSLSAAIQTDAHYFRVAQTLRLCRRAMGLAGLKLISVTPGSRLNDHFPFLSVHQAARRILDQTGDPTREQTRGRYSTLQTRHPLQTSPMRDVRPHFWPAAKTDLPQKSNAVGNGKGTALRDPLVRLRQAVEELPEVPIDLNAEK